jgi:hypothetical protein
MFIITSHSLLRRLGNIVSLLATKSNNLSFEFLARLFNRLFANKNRAKEINYLCENSAYRQGKSVLVVRRGSGGHGNPWHGVALFV